MNYNEYINQFEIYDSKRKARAKGYEAHHILPVALQKDSESFDDRCVRLTPFQHIYAHYLLALENEDAIKIFYFMVCQNEFKLSDIEKVTLEDLENWATLRENGRVKISDETRKKISEARKGMKHSEETRKKLSEAHKGIKRSEETRAKISITKQQVSYAYHHCNPKNISLQEFQKEYKKKKDLT